MLTSLTNLVSARGSMPVDSQYFKNPLYPNGFPDEYRENLWLIAKNHFSRFDFGVDRT